MKIINLTLLFTLIYNQQILAFDLPLECKNSLSTDCSECSTQSPSKDFTNKIDKLTVPMNMIGNYSFLKEKVLNLSKVNETLKKELTALSQAIGRGTSGTSDKGPIDEINNIKSDFERLTVLSREAIILQRKFNICINNCSPLQKIEIEDELKKIRKIKASIFIKQPILANKAFEERMKNINDSMIDNDLFFPANVFEKDLANALADNLEKIETRSKEYSQFQKDEKNINENKDDNFNLKKYLDNMTSHFPGIMEDVVNNSFYDGAFSHHKTNFSACFCAELFKKYSDRKEYKEIAIDAGLFIIPFFAGPLGEASALGIGRLFDQRLAAWTIKSLSSEKVINAGSTIFQAGLIGAEFSKVREMSESCRKIELEFLSKSDDEKLKKLRDCQKNLGEKVFADELGLMLLGSTNISLSAIKFLSREVKDLKIPFTVNKEMHNTLEISEDIHKNGMNQLKKGQVGIEFTTPKDGFFSLLDLNKVMKTMNPLIKKIPEEYWGYVGSLYQERLKLTKDEIASFIKTSMEMSSRTKLIINTRSSPLAGHTKINGGVAIVQSTSVEELLPLEKATGIRITKKTHEKIVEIVRLTVGKDSDSEKICEALISQVGSLLLQDKSTSRIFIFTSKIHARLYKRMGISTENMKEIDKRDVVIELNRADVEKFVEKIKNKMSILKTSYYLPVGLYNISHG